MAAVYALLGLLVFLVALLALPRVLLRRAQDRLARQVMEREGEAFKLLTRADLVAGQYRRIPGVLALKEGTLEFEGLFGNGLLLPTSRIQKIATGKRLASGRSLLRLEVLRLTRSSGEEIEFVLHPASALAWRSHLGLWAVRERQRDADRVSPGRAEAGSSGPRELPPTGVGPLRPR
jgi:hypothetical protein